MSTKKKTARGSKSNQARALAKKHPQMGLQQIADCVGMRRQSVVDALRTVEGKKARPAKRKRAARKAAKR